MLEGQIRFNINSVMYKKKSYFLDNKLTHLVIRFNKIQCNSCKCVKLTEENLINTSTPSPLHTLSWEFVKENKKVRKQEKYAFDQVSDKKKQEKKKENTLSAKKAIKKKR